MTTRAAPGDPRVWRQAPPPDDYNQHVDGYYPALFCENVACWCQDSHRWEIMAQAVIQHWGGLDASMTDDVLYGKICLPTRLLAEKLKEYAHGSE